MSRLTTLVPALILTVLPTGFAALPDAHRFDGKWLTTLSCPAYGNAMGFSWHWVSTVKDGGLHGLYGTAGQPASIQIDGNIAPNGTASLFAKGHTGAKQYVVGDLPVGADFSYNIDAHFEAVAGTGTRIEGRPCSYKFTRQ
jgi:hypothetical protein